MRKKSWQDDEKFQSSHFLRVESFQLFFLPFVKLADNFHSFHIPTCFVVLKISLNGLSDMFWVWGYEHRRHRRLRNVTNYCWKWDFMHTFVFKKLSSRTLFAQFNHLSMTHWIVWVIYSVKVKKLRKLSTIVTFTITFAKTIIFEIFPQTLRRSCHR